MCHSFHLSFSVSVVRIKVTFWTWHWSVLCSWQKKDKITSDASEKMSKCFPKLLSNVNAPSLVTDSVLVVHFSSIKKLVQKFLWASSHSAFTAGSKKLDRTPACVCVNPLIYELLSFFFHVFGPNCYLLRLQASCWQMPPNSLTFRIIVSCFTVTVHRGQRSRPVSAVALWGHREDATWSSGHSDPAYYGLQTIWLFTFLPSETGSGCRGPFPQLFSFLQHFT